MKTLADLKKRLQVGTILVLTGHTWGHKALGIPRKIIKRQTNSIQFDGGAWLPWPKASELQITVADTFTLTPADCNGLIMSYQILEDAK